MLTLLPTDQNNNPIPALRLKDNGAHQIAASATSSRNSTAFDAGTQIISIYATTPVHLRFGDSSITATATDHYFPSGVYYDVAIGGDGAAHHAYIAVLRESTDGIVYISEKI
ncbi:MAG: hypothetical protein PHX61_14780 [Alphaproteobacteria bacterium]|nr:hypothetical protein [Alphaproteobacteria bacterium]